MLSRVASTLYWQARYLERAENTARIINVNSHLLLDLPKSVVLGWEPIVDILSNRELFYSLHDDATEHAVISFMVTDKANPSSIISSLSAARENARTIREIIPREAWEQINALYLYATENQKNVFSRRQRYDYLNKIILANQTITGMLAGTMTHDDCYEFICIGSNIERADMTTRIIDVRSASLLPDIEHELSAFDNIQWMSVLKSLTGYQMYRREMRLRINRADVLKFLLQEEHFPRSLRHALQQVERRLERLPRNHDISKALQGANKQLMSAKPEKLKQDKLHEFIDQMQIELDNLHDSISHTYF
ncbi:alpha-E domain-containing protein [Shewanella sp. SG41-4]|nr:alpha-E domain-containing protein [Shewanella sp. SG41-4]MBB1440869.1 alpha-E domain-containing protein [Shewanella sp. SG41-4]